ncbi:hypothetical protein PAHA111176_17280 [Parendozoicomonas haliclonae]|uniref:Uncharacterized protein n=1 Tax=Parendozoicomonas haliclonae TaxID=1960125 RepID=A0A1X7ANT6_9GAMM|nr:hypothetical protein EHSB41UT_03592 [Parendozoicomonas haliclonae]
MGMGYRTEREQRCWRSVISKCVERPIRLALWSNQAAKQSLPFLQDMLLTGGNQKKEKIEKKKGGRLGDIQPAFIEINERRYKPDEHPAKQSPVPAGR